MQKATISFDHIRLPAHPSFRMEKFGSTGRIFMKFDT
jgi:hypothetical protein